MFFARLIAGVFVFAACATSRTDRLVIASERMLDVDAGQYVPDVVVYIEGGRIAEVTTGQPAKRSYGRVLEVQTLLPGLIDAHTHLAWSSASGEDAAKATIEAGFTTVRNLGSDSDADVKLKEKTAAPRMLLSGPGLGPKDGICHQTFGDGSIVNGPEDARAKVRQQVQGRGARVIKVCAGGGVLANKRDEETIELDPQTLEAIVDEAHKLGVKVAAHAQGPRAIRNAANAGVDSVEHGSLIDRETAILMRDRNVSLVPTLARIATRIERAKSQGAAADVLERLEANRKLVYGNVSEAIRVGVPIVLGTDATVLPHGQNARELQALVDVGLTPLEAIRAATTRAAALLGLDDVGRIRRGAVADLVAVDGDPLTDVSVLERPRAVIAGGKIVWSAAAPAAAF